MRIRIEDYYQDCDAILDHCNIQEGELELKSINSLIVILKQLFLNDLDFWLHTTNELTVVYVYKKGAL